MRDLTFLGLLILIVCVSMAIGNTIAYLPKSNLKPGDCVKALGSDLVGTVGAISGDAAEVIFNMPNDQIIPLIYSINRLVKVECLK